MFSIVSMRLSISIYLCQDPAIFVGLLGLCCIFILFIACFLSSLIALIVWHKWKRRIDWLIYVSNNYIFLFTVTITSMFTSSILLFFCCLFTYKPDVNIGRAGETKDTKFLGRPAWSRLHLRLWCRQLFSFNQWWMGHKGWMGHTLWSKHVRHEIF